MNFDHPPFQVRHIAGYSLSASLLVLAIVYGQNLFTAVSIAQPALFQG